MISYTNHTDSKRGSVMEFQNGKYAWMVKVGEKGQFVIPKEAREMFDLHPVSLLCVETEMFKHSHAVMTSLIINLLSNSENIKIEGEKCRFKYEKYYSPLNRNVWRELYSFN